MFFKICPFVLLGIFFLQCKMVPKEKLSQWNQPVAYTVANDTLKIEVSNILNCPLRMDAASKQKEIQALLTIDFPRVLPPGLDTFFSYPPRLQKQDLKLSFNFTMGDPNTPVADTVLQLPFPKGKSFRIVQGYNGKFSHRTDYSRYALDFNLQPGDTIAAAASGYVVGVISGYKHGGNNKKWRDYANFITIYHPHLNLFTQYVHLKYEGSLVAVGDAVSTGQPIGLAGKTGFTSTPHLHFNALRATDDGMSSVRITFAEGYVGSSLKEGDRVLNPK